MSMLEQTPLHYSELGGIKCLWVKLQNEEIVPLFPKAKSQTTPFGIDVVIDRVYFYYYKGELYEHFYPPNDELWEVSKELFRLDKLGNHLDMTHEIRSQWTPIAECGVLKV